MDIDELKTRLAFLYAAINGTPIGNIDIRTLGDLPVQFSISNSPSTFYIMCMSEFSYDVYISFNKNYTNGLHIEKSAGYEGWAPLPGEHTPERAWQEAVAAYTAGMALTNKEGTTTNGEFTAKAVRAILPRKPLSTGEDK